MPREIVKLIPNVPVEMALQYPTGKLVTGNFGEQVMFGLKDNRTIYLDLGPAQKVNDLTLTPGETFFACVRWSGKKGDQREFDCWLSPATEKRRAQQSMPLEPPEVTTSDLERKLQDSILLNEARKREAGRATEPPVPPRGTGTYGPAPTPAAPPRPAMAAAGGNVRTMPPTKRQFGDAFEQFLVDAARAVKRAEFRLAEEGIVTQFGPDASKSMATTMFIEAAKQGFVTWNGGQQ